MRHLQHDEGAIFNVLFDPSGTRLAVAGGDKAVRIYDVASGRELRRLDHADETWGLAFTPDGQRLATAGVDRLVRIWNAETGELVADGQGHEGTVVSVSASVDGEWFASSALDHSVRLWSVDGRRIVKLLNGERPLWWVAFSPSGRYLAAASLDGHVYVWSLDVLKAILSGSPAEIGKAAQAHTGLSVDRAGATRPIALATGAAAVSATPK